LYVIYVIFLEFGLNLAKNCKFFANFWRNFVSTLQPDLGCKDKRGGKGDGGGGGGVYNAAS
jgi:hypothetical protein